MAYEKLNLTDGTIFTAEHVAHIENGIANSAPAGYGLGETGGKTVTDVNAAICPGFYAMSGHDAVNVPESCEIFKYGTLLVEARSNTEHQYTDIYQTFRYGTATATRLSVTSGADWTEWEWINPPMVPGVEYRTTNRFNRKTVYTKLLDCGAAANAKSITYDVTKTRLLDIVVNIGTYPARQKAAGDDDNTSAYYATYYLTGTSVTLYCGTSMVGQQSYAQIWYIKD